MIRVTFISADDVSGGSAPRDVFGGEGDSLLRVGQAHGQPLEGTCEGQMACSTCHVIVSPSDIGLLPPPSEEEEDLLDLATGATRTSRLACQIVLTPALDGLTVRLPPGSR